MAESRGAWPPLLAAAHAGDVAAVKAAMSTCSTHDLGALTTPRGDGALHLAAHAAHIEVLTLLLDASGATLLDAKNAAGWTPLQLSILADVPPAKRLGCVRLLLARGADAAAATSEGSWTAALLAAQRGDAPVLAALLAGGGAALEARNAQGDDVLMLAALAGSEACVRVALAGGAACDVRNARGLDAVTLALCAACAEEEPGNAAGDADASDAATCAFERIAELLVCAGSDVTGGRGYGPLHVLATAPQQVPLRRLVALASTLRRLGFDDLPSATPEATGGPADDGASLPSTLAAQHGRAALASILRAPPPPPLALLCVRRPLEGSAPTSILVMDGALRRPLLEAEGEGVRLAVCRQMASAEDGHRNASLTPPRPTAAGQARTAETAEAEEAAAGLAAEAAAALLGGARRRCRTFRLVAELPASASDGCGPPTAAALPAVRAAVARRRATARAASPDADALPVAAAATAATAAAAAARRLPVYRQVGRWGEGEVELIELAPQVGAPLLHDAHVDLLREFLGEQALDDEIEADEPRERPWAIFAEELVTARAEGADGGEEGAWQAAAELWSSDAPLLLAFAVEAEERREAMMSSMGSDDETGEEEGESDGEEWRGGRPAVPMEP